VVVFRSALLPISETFILTQAQALRRWRPVLVGYERTYPSLDLGSTPSLLLNGRSGGTGMPWVRSLMHCTGWGQRQMAARLGSLHPDLIHVHFGTDAVNAWHWLKWLQVPVVVTLHGYDASIDPQWWVAGHGGRRERNYPARLAALAREPRVHFVAVSDALKQRAVEQYGLAADCITVIHLGVDERRFRPRGIPAGHRPRRVLYVGRMVEKKAADVLIHAMAVVRQQLPDAQVVLVGAGPLRTQFETLARSLGVNAQFLGGQPPESVQHELDQARVFCLPSVTARNGDTEGMPIAILEAQSAGLPVVTSAVGGRDEAIEDGVTGFAFSEGDVGQLAGHLLALLRDDELATRLGHHGAARVAAHFRLADCTERLEAFYDNVRASYATAPRPSR
jgi:glycosyltransferase involved in cell wall biosynthesis